jgi:hypothetical protein
VEGSSSLPRTCLNRLLNPHGQAGGILVVAAVLTGSTVDHSGVQVDAHGHGRSRTLNELHRLDALWLLNFTCARLLLPIKLAVAGRRFY